MRKALFKIGWVIFFVLPIIYGVQIYLAQDLPKVEIWQWGILAATVMLIYFTRDRDDVLKHHVV
jgi:hypothetical protein